MDEMAIAVIALRFLLPLCILRFPLVGVIACAMLDVYDYHFIGGYEWYQVVDKLLDIYYLGIAAFTVLKWQDITAKWIALSAYLYRVVGVVLTMTLDQRWLLMVFPNFFEPFFIFYLLFVYMSKTTKMLTSRWIAVAVIAVLLLPKLVQEYVLHVYQPNQEAAPVWMTRFIQHLEQIAWVGIPLYVLPPAMLLLYLVFKARRSNGTARAVSRRRK